MTLNKSIADYQLSKLFIMSKLQLKSISNILERNKINLELNNNNYEESTYEH